MEIGCEKCKDKQYPPNETNTPYIKCGDCGRDLSTPSEAQNQRTLAQNRALHKWFEELANEFNDRGLDVRAVLKPEVDIPWDKDMVKRFIFHPVQRIKLDKSSTTELTTAQVSEVVDVLNRHFVDKFNFSLPFPSDEYFREVQ